MYDKENCKYGISSLGVIQCDTILLILCFPIDENTDNGRKYQYSCTCTYVISYLLVQPEDNRQEVSSYQDPKQIT
jgi:hypothetical protein